MKAISPSYIVADRPNADRVRIVTLGQCWIYALMWQLQFRSYSMHRQHKAPIDFRHMLRRHVHQYKIIITYYTKVLSACSNDFSKKQLKIIDKTRWWESLYLPHLQIPTDCFAGIKVFFIWYEEISFYLI